MEEVRSDANNCLPVRLFATNTLVKWKNPVGKGYISYDELVDESLCDG